MSRIVSLWDQLLKLLAAIVGILLLFAMASVSVDVVGRYFLNAPIGWVLEVTEYILLYTPFLGMAWLVQRAEGHVRIDVVVRALSDKVQAGLNVIVCAIAATACGAAAYFAGWTTWDHYARSVETYGIYPIPKWLLLIVIAVGFALTTVELVRKGLRHFAEWRDPPPGIVPLVSLGRSR